MVVLITLRSFSRFRPRRDTGSSGPTNPLGIGQFMETYHPTMIHNSRSFEDTAY